MKIFIQNRVSLRCKMMLKTALHKSGLEVMDDKKAMMIEKIINIIVEMMHYSDELSPVNFSARENEFRSS